jgi:hypothetical protein
MSQFGVGMVFAWWRFGVDSEICLGVAMGFVAVWECWREGMLVLGNVGVVECWRCGMLALWNVGVVECRYSRTGIACCVIPRRE